MSEPLEEFTEPANLRLLRRLVTGLMITMIVGFVALIALFAMRLTDTAATAPQIPSEITLPDGTKAEAFTQGTDWWAIVTTDDRILIYNRSDNQLRQTISVQQ